MRRNSIGRLWSKAAFGEVVAVTRPRPKKALEPRGHAGHNLYSQSWTNKITYMLVKDHEGRRTVKRGLEPTLLDQQ
eukprot:8604227-Prorocentrum_lima.AAC.1